MRAAGSVPSAHVRLPRARAWLVLGLLLAGFVVMVGRAIYLQGFNDDFLQARGEARFTRVIDISANRGIVTDRDGEPLAISTPVEGVAVIPGDVRKLEDAQIAALVRAYE